MQLNPGSVIPPGFDHANNEYGSFPGLLEAEKKNIQHTNVRFPFYPINPELLLTDDFRYWSKTLKPFLKSEKSYEKVSKDISCIEFFPYHSANFNFREKLHCQKYGFYLLEKAIERKAMIVLMRAKKEWLDAVPELKKIDYCVLKQVRNVSLSEKNMMPGDFQSLGEILG